MLRGVVPGARDASPEFAQKPTREMDVALKKEVAETSRPRRTCTFTQPARYRRAVHTIPQRVRCHKSKRARQKK